MKLLDFHQRNTGPFWQVMGSMHCPVKCKFSSKMGATSSIPRLNFPACALYASPKQARAMPARPRPNFLKAWRRETACARLLVSSSNWYFIVFVDCCLYFAPEEKPEFSWITYACG